MPHDDHKYFIEKIPAIRILIREAFTPATLRRFCQDRGQFRPVSFSPKANLDDMAAALIEHCRTQVLFGDLLAEIEKVRFPPPLIPPVGTGGIFWPPPRQRSAAGGGREGGDKAATFPPPPRIASGRRPNLPISQRPT